MLQKINAPLGIKNVNFRSHPEFFFHRLSYAKNNTMHYYWHFIQFKQITKAYSTLSDPRRRMVYDQFGEEAAQKHEQAETVQYQRATDQEVWGQWLTFILQYAACLFFDWLFSIPLEW